MEKTTQNIVVASLIVGCSRLCIIKITFSLVIMWCLVRCFFSFIMSFNFSASFICLVVVAVSGVVGLIVCLPFDESWQNELLTCLSRNGSIFCYFAHIHTKTLWARSRPLTLHAYFVRNMISVDCSRITHLFHIAITLPKNSDNKKKLERKNHTTEKS